jgi:hypothetical protein
MGASNPLTADESSEILYMIASNPLTNFFYECDEPE